MGPQPSDNTGTDFQETVDALFQLEEKEVEEEGDKTSDEDTPYDD